MRVIVKDLNLHGEEGVLQLGSVHKIALKKKENVVNYVTKNLSVDELVLIEPFGENVLPTYVEEFLNDLKAISSVKVLSSVNILQSILLPPNVEILESFELEEVFSSSPVNNYPKALAGGNLINVEVPPIWIYELRPDVEDPVAKVEEFIKRIDKGNVVVVLNTVLTSAEHEAIESLAKETGGFVIDVLEEFIDPLDDIEAEFSKRIRNRMGKLLGMKALRGERL